MLSRHWGALLAAIGLTIVAFGSGAYLVAVWVSAEQTSRVYQRKLSSVRGKSADVAVTATFNATKMPADEAILTEPCAPTVDNRNSDLCAQWKAADAARDAAWWAMFGTLVAAVGTLGLYWQIYLTRKAVEETGEATEAMREANKIAMDNSHLELRAYLAVNSVTLDESDWDDDQLHITIELQNAGQTPATLKNVHIKAIWATNGGSVTLIDHTSKNDIRCHRDTPMHIPFGFKDDAEKLEEMGHLMVFGRIEYRDVFGTMQKEPFSYQTPAGASFFLAFHEHSLPLRLAAFSPLAVLDAVEEEKTKRKAKNEVSNPSQ